MPLLTRQNNGSDPTHGAVLPRYVLEIKLRPHLSDISLDNVLSGDTCSPIGLADFEGYLMFKEYTVENLQFVVWFQDYRARYYVQHKEERPSNPPSPKDCRFALPSAARIARRIVEHPHDAEPSVTEGTCMGSESHTAATPTSCSAPDRFRRECARVVATFFTPSAEKELSFDAALRDSVLRALAAGHTHPDVFLQAYEEVYATLATVSLPRFLTAASTNINRPKQLYWYGTGLAYFVVALVVAAAVPSRAWRLFAVPFSGMGMMSVHSGWRGFCTEVWARGTTQLRTWELLDAVEDTPEEEPRPSSDARESSHADRQVRSQASSASASSSSLADLACLADTDTDTDIAKPAGDLPKTRPRAHAHAHAHSPTSPYAHHPSSLASPPSPSTLPLPPSPDPDLPATPAFAPPNPPPNLRPPMFGPERVVLDPRIRAVHRQAMMDLLRVGTVWTVLFTATVVCVPSRG